MFGDQYFLAFACAGSVARSLCGCAAGATRAALTQHFARRANAADIAAKEGSQETAVTLVGMALGVVVTRVTAKSVASQWWGGRPWGRGWRNILKGVIRES